MARRLLKDVLGLAAMMALIWVGACMDSGPGVTEATDLDILMAPPSQDPDPDPQSVAPDSVLQATTDTLLIAGEHFEPGDQVGWLLNGKGTDDIVTMASQVVDAETIVAVVEVAGDAELTTFDVEVRGGGKRKGIGTDLLRVEVGGNGPPASAPQVTWTMDDSQGGLTSDGNPTYSYTHPDILADIDVGRARLYTNQGKRKGKHQDPERMMRIDISGAFTYSKVVHAYAQTTRELDVEFMSQGTEPVPFRIMWWDGNDNYMLRWGQTCELIEPVDSERVEITRHDATAFTLRSLPGVPARLCINNELAAHPVQAPFLWTFVVDEP